ncbi:hypothetical protein BDV11DRAFT_205939 [Aspergillus similis]
MVKTEPLRRKNKKSESRITDILPNNQTPMECTAQVDHKITSKRQREVDDNKFSDGQMPVRRTVHSASKAHGGIFEPACQRDLSENIEYDGPCGNECVGNARDTELTAKPLKRVAWDLPDNISEPLQSFAAPLPLARHPQSAVVPKAVQQKDPPSGSEPFSEPVMAESSEFVQNSDFVTSSNASIDCHEQAQTATFRPSLTSSGSRSQKEVVRPTVSEDTLKEEPGRIQKLPTVLPAQQTVDPSEGKINDIEDLTNMDADPDARIQELEDCVVAQALKLVSQAKEIKSLAETVNELRERIQNSPDSKYKTCKCIKEHPDYEKSRPQRE